MNVHLDRYTWHARTLPIYFACTPLVLALAAILPEALTWSLGGTSSLVLVPISYFLSQVSADAGKRLEAELWASWGGPPTTRLLRHGNTELNATTRARVHASLRKLGLEIPSPTEQVSNPDRAIELYASATDELRRLTRDRQRFALVFQGNVGYGFRRNLLGMKATGVCLASFCLVVSAYAVWYEWASAGSLAFVPTVCFVIIGLILLGWLLRVSPAAVKLTADRYARYLLEAARDLEPK